MTPHNKKIGNAEIALGASTVYNGMTSLELRTKLLFGLTKKEIECAQNWTGPWYKNYLDRLNTVRVKAQKNQFD